MRNDRAVLLGARRVAHRLPPEKAAVAHQMREHRDALIGPLSDLLWLRDLARDRQPIADSELLHPDPSSASAQTTLRGRANAAPTRQPNVEHHAAADAPDFVAPCTDDLSVLDSEHFGRRADEFL